jgi:chitin deacetylase
MNSSAFPSYGPSQPNNGYPQYKSANGSSLAGTDPTVCSFTYQCVGDGDIYNAPDGVIGLNFDDGPTSFSSELYDFIEANNISATHFMIGGNILNFPDVFARAWKDGGKFRVLFLLFSGFWFSFFHHRSTLFIGWWSCGDLVGHIAVHTWSHPYMTSMTNEQILAELGWTCQIISDLTGGYVPAYWVSFSCVVLLNRCWWMCLFMMSFYSDLLLVTWVTVTTTKRVFKDTDCLSLQADYRVRMIAKEVFGLTTVVWNQDSADWAIGTNPQYTVDSVTTSMRQWFSGPKSPGLVMLEHEASAADVQVFKAVYGDMLKNGWKVVNVAEAFNSWEYANAAKDNSTQIQGESIVQTLAPDNMKAYGAAFSGMQSAHEAGVTQSAQTTQSSSSAASTTGSSSSSSAGSVSSPASAPASATGSSTASRTSGAAGTGTSGAVAAATGSTSGALRNILSSSSTGALAAVAILAGSALL